jgi:hypothetical protein
MNHTLDISTFRLSILLTITLIFTCHTFVRMNFSGSNKVPLTCFPASALQSFMLGAGIPTSVPCWTRSFPMPTRLTSHATLNPLGRKAWRIDGPTEGKCLWEMHGVWGWDLDKKEGIVLRENYFVKHPQDGHKVS